MASADGITTQVSITSFTINGVDISRHINNMQIYEDICKPYLTATVMVIDNVDIVNQLKLVGGEKVSFTVQADGGGTYTSGNMQLFSIKGQRSSLNLRTTAYQLEIIGSEYFGDRQNLIQQSFKNITGTDMISKVHQQYLGSPLTIPVPSIGLLGQGNPIIASSARPFKFIDDIRRQLMFGGFQTGSTLHYRDNKAVNLAPMEYLFSNLQPQNTFIQKATWGASWQDIFNAGNAIIAAQSTYDDHHNSGGQLNMRDISAAIKQEKRVIDIFSHKRIFNDSPQTISPGVVAGTPIATLINLIGSSTGGRHNYYFFDSEKFPKANIRQTDKEALYKAMMTSGPQIIIKVPAQGGFNVTVGKGFTAKILPPMSDFQDSVGYDATNSGNYLATKIMHDLHFSDATPGGTTTIHGVKGGLNQ